MDDGSHQRMHPDRIWLGRRVMWRTGPGRAGGLGGRADPRSPWL